MLPLWLPPFFVFVTTGWLLPRLSPPLGFVATFVPPLAFVADGWLVPPVDC